MFIITAMPSASQMLARFAFWNTLRLVKVLNLVERMNIPVTQHAAMAVRGPEGETTILNGEHQKDSTKLFTNTS